MAMRPCKLGEVRRTRDGVRAAARGPCLLSLRGFVRLRSRGVRWGYQKLDVLEQVREEDGQHVVRPGSSGSRVSNDAPQRGR